MTDPKPVPMLKEPGDMSGIDPFNPAKPLPEYMQRMAKETQAVVTNLRALSEFIEGNGMFTSLPVLERRLMVAQMHEMEAYAKTLSLRYCMALLDHG